MLPLTETTLRASFVNASQRERAGLSLPAQLEELDWDSLDFLAWRDRKFTNLGYVIVDLDGAATGILLRQSDSRMRTRPQCSWCEDIELRNNVVFFSAKRSGEAGRNGDTVGTLVCANFECAANARKRPTTAYIGFDVEAARQRRIAVLREHVQGFVRDIRDGR